MIHLKTILHPTDFSEDSRYALEVACAIARDQAAHVVLLHVLPRPALIGRDAQVPAFKDAHTAEDLQAYREEVMGRLERMRDEAAYADVQPLLREGDAVEVILRAAEETPCDLIVLGSHGKSRMYQLMMGSVATGVARRAPCPVVTVKKPQSVPSAAAGPGKEATCQTR
jgi:nucleotide-binding universal stress UspA family protein